MIIQKATTVLLNCALALWGCAAPHVMRQGWEAGAGVGELTAVSEHAFDQVESLTAEVSISFRGPQGSGSASAAIVYRKPRDLHLEVMGPLFRPVLSADVIGDSMVIVAGDDTWDGPVSEGLRRYLPMLDMGDYDLRYALIGIVAPWKVSERANVTYPRGDRAIASIAEAGGANRKVWFDLHRGFALREEATSPAGNYWRRDLRDYRPVGIPLQDAPPLYLPRSVRIRQSDSEIEIEFRNYSVTTVKSSTVLGR